MIFVKIETTCDVHLGGGEDTKPSHLLFRVRKGLPDLISDFSCVHRAVSMVDELKKVKKYSHRDLSILEYL